MKPGDEVIVFGQYKGVVVKPKKNSRPKDISVRWTQDGSKFEANVPREHVRPKK